MIKKSASYVLALYRLFVPQPNGGLVFLVVIQRNIFLIHFEVRLRGRFPPLGISVVFFGSDNSDEISA